MHFVIWVLIGVVVAMVMGTGPRRQLHRFSTNGTMLAGSFGALLGGVVGDGLPGLQAAALTLPSILAAAVGALIFCLAVRGRAFDTGA